jgi:hypothetical protein
MIWNVGLEEKRRVKNSTLNVKSHGKVLRTRNLRFSAKLCVISCGI